MLGTATADYGRNTDHSILGSARRLDLQEALSLFLRVKERWALEERVGIWVLRVDYLLCTPSVVVLARMIRLWGEDLMVRW